VLIEFLNVLRKLVEWTTCFSRTSRHSRHSLSVALSLPSQQRKDLLQRLQVSLTVIRGNCRFTIAY